MIVLPDRGLCNWKFLSVSQLICYCAPWNVTLTRRRNLPPYYVLQLAKFTSLLRVTAGEISLFITCYSWRNLPTLRVTAGEIYLLVRCYSAKFTSLSGVTDDEIYHQSAVYKWGEIYLFLALSHVVEFTSCQLCKL